MQSFKIVTVNMILKTGDFNSEREYYILKA